MQLQFDIPCSQHGYLSASEMIGFFSEQTWWLDWTPYRFGNRPASLHLSRVPRKRLSAPKSFNSLSDIDIATPVHVTGFISIKIFLHFCAQLHVHNVIHLGLRQSGCGWQVHACKRFAAGDFKNSCTLVSSMHACIRNLMCNISWSTDSLSLVLVCCFPNTKIEHINQPNAHKQGTRASESQVSIRAKVTIDFQLFSWQNNVYVTFGLEQHLHCVGFFICILLACLLNLKVDEVFNIFRYFHGTLRFNCAMTVLQTRMCEFIV